jgi:RNA polymerase sigma factor (sigma-70 family)
VADGVFLQAYSMLRRAVAVRAAALRLTPDDRADIEQEVALGLVRALPRFNQHRAGLGTFVAAVAQNVMASLWRRERKMGMIASESIEDLEVAVAAPGYGLELYIDVDRVLRRIRPLDRMVAVLLVDHSPAMVGRRLGISRSSVYRAIGRLRAAFTAAGLAPTTCQKRRREWAA